MRVLLSFSFIVLLGAPWPLFGGMWSEYPTVTDRAIDFGLSYPYLVFKDSAQIKRRNGGSAAGVSFNYQFFLTQMFGLVIYPNLWVAPIRINGSDFTAYGLGLEGGVVVRPLAKTYFDPTMSATFGIARTKSGGSYETRASYPLSTQLGFNLWRESVHFQDHHLAFRAILGFHHYLRMVKAFEPGVFEFGIALRGSF